MTDMRHIILLVEKLYTDYEQKIHPDDHMKPSMMVKPKVLFRSVSIPELANIWNSGEIRGGQNSFNDFEHRSYVFFGDTLNDELIWQGEELERQVTHKLGSHPAHRKMRALNMEIEDQKNMVGYHLRDPQSYKYDDLPSTELINDALDGSYDASNQIRNLLKPRALAVFKELQDMRQKARTLGDEYRVDLGKEYTISKKRVGSYAFSSAVLQTRPIDGGVEYAENSGMTQREYGFQPGEVSLRDVTKVFWVKNGKIVDQSTPDEIGTRLDRSGFYDNL